MTAEGSHQTQVATGIRRLGLLSIAATVLQVLQLTLVARWVGAGAIGVMTMVLSVAGFVMLIQDFGTSNAMIRQPDLRGEQITSVFWFQVTGGVVISLLSYLVAPVAAQLFAEPQLTDALRQFSPYFIITSLGLAANALLERDLEFRTVSRNEFTAVCTGVLVSITLAWFAAGVAALVYGQLAAAVVKTLLNLFATRKVLVGRLQLHFVSIRPFLDFGVFHMGQRLLNFLSANFDYILVGRFFGADNLGIYAVVFNLANVGPARITPVFSRVFFPAFSKFAADRVVLKREYFAAQHILGAVNCPLAALIIALSPVALPLFLGPSWATAVGLLQMLTLAAALRGSAGATGALILAVGRSRTGFAWSIFSLAVTAPCLIASSLFGDLTGFGFAVLASSGLLWFLSYPMLIRDILQTSFAQWLGTVVAPVLIALATGLVALAIARIMVGAQSWLVFAGSATIGGAVCWLLVRRFDAPALAYFRTVTGVSAVD